MKNKGNILHLFLFGTLMVIMFLPMLQEHVRIFTFKPLDGSTVNAERPKFTFDNYRSGVFQSQTEKYIGENFGFREPVIRLYNQYLWDLFRTTNAKTIVIGKNNYLYGKEVVDDYVGNYMFGYAKDLEQLKNNLCKEAIRLRKVQEILAQYDRHLFVLMEPSKAKVYPEFLPDGFVVKPNNITAADIYPRLFDSLGVNYLNFDAWFQKIRNSVDYELYPQTGTHWSNIAALHATDSILRYMERLGRRGLANLAIDTILFDTTMAPDNDLGKLMNVERNIATVPDKFADFKIVNDTLSEKPALLTIGDSYYWNISYHIPLDEIFSSHRFWYYNSTIYYDASHRSTNEINMLEQLMASDFIMVSYCTTMLYAMSNYFSAKALVHLCCSKERVKQVLHTIGASIYNTPEWLAKVQQKAESNGVPIESMIAEEAKYMLYNQPEDYFPELGLDHPIARNEMLRMYDSEDPIGKILHNMMNDKAWMDGLKQKANDSSMELETVMLRDAEWLYRRQHP